MPSGGGDKAYSLATRVGRLIEARVFGLRTRDDADAYAGALGAHVIKMPATMQPVLLADHRPVVIYPQPAADRLVELFTHMNTRLERVAILCAPTNATLVLQLERIVREAGYTKRRVFYVADDAQAHLAPALTPQELDRVRSFLDEYPPRSQRGRG